METGQAVMAGLFPAEGNRVWNASTEWQPTPMHTNGKGREDPLLKPTGVFCPNYEAIRKRDFHRLEMRMDKKYGGLFDWLSAETGMNVSFANVKKLYDVDKEIMHSLPQPDWVYTSWEGEKVLNLIRELKRLSRMEDFNSFKKARFRGGYLLNDWLTRIEEVEVRKKTPKAVLYSSHDGTVASLMHAMGVTDNQLVPFAGCFFVEVVRDEANDLYVQMFYRNATLGDPQILRLKNCSTECPVTDFIRLLEPNRIRSEIELKTICSCASNKGLMFFIYILLVKFASF
ncbi:unnamed protein product, partial [Mesorhabditis belari]|uniref:Acid phosphatase n=1 Tax=Mesorhabditis belari TaxID=2138241 RepID=A0AAF3FM08_9BILA